MVAVVGSHGAHSRSENTGSFPLALRWGCIGAGKLGQGSARGLTYLAGLWWRSREGVTAAVLSSLQEERRDMQRNRDHICSKPPT